MSPPPTLMQGDTNETAPAEDQGEGQNEDKAEDGENTKKRRRKSRWGGDESAKRKVHNHSTVAKTLYYLLAVVARPLVSLNTVYNRVDVITIYR